MDNISIIVAMDKNNAIGYKNNLLCYIPEDLKYFKNITLNNTIVVGLDTYMSFPKKPLPNRKNIVLSKNRLGIIDKTSENIVAFNNIEAVLEYAKNNKDEKIFICGGESVYKQFLEYASKLYITFIDEEFEADTYFPKVNFEKWNLEEEINPKEIENSKFKYVFKIYTKK